MDVIVPFIIVLFFVLITAGIDLWKFKIHNVITFPLLVTGVAYHGMVFGVHGPHGIVASLLGVLFGVTVMGGFYFMGGMGAGDVKLMAAIGAWLCLPTTLAVFVASALVCGIYAVILIVATGRFKATVINFKIMYHRMAAVGRHLAAEDHVEVAVTQDDRRSRVIPFAAMVAVGMASLLAIAWFVRP